MKKIVLTCAAILAFAGSAFASNEIVPETTIEQEESLVITNAFPKNWEMSVGLGAQAFIGEYISKTKFVDAIKFPSIDFDIQKWASPSFGIGLGFNASKFGEVYSPANTTATFRTDSDPAYGTEGLKMMTGWTGNLFVKANVNLTNMFCGYRPDRVFEMLAYVGGGVIFPMHVQNYFAITGSFNAGLTAQFNVCKHFAIDINVRGAVIGDGLNGISYLSGAGSKSFPLDGNIGATLGLKWKFGFQKKSGEAVPWVTLAAAAATSSTLAAAVKDAEAAAKAKAKADADKLQSELDAANAKINAKQAEIDDLNAKLANSKCTKSSVIWQYSGFKIGSSSITNREKVGLQACAEYIKNADGKFVVTGYADNASGSAKVNQALSQKRAEAVYNALVNEYGVDADKLSVEAKGGVDNMFFNDPQFSRSVIVSTVE